MAKDEDPNKIYKIRVPELSTLTSKKNKKSRKRSNEDGSDDEDLYTRLTQEGNSFDNRN
jgi:hypothetical protein